MSNSPFDRPTPPVEPLTRREHEILARLAGDLYNREIAEALTLAPNSIKWYTRQIYAKLGVNSRQEAIRRAHELGLLDHRSPAVFHPHNLPISLTPFVGRQNELEQIHQLLADPTCRMVTLTGAGGVGKTRLALKVANEVQGNYPQGAWLVELASLSEAELVPQTVATVFDLRPGGERSILSALIDHLRARNLLLVLDNCEHLVSTCASLTNSLLQACPSLHILTTSREALGIAGECTYLVPSLSFPEPGQATSPEGLIKYESADLFTRRAKAALPGFELNDENASAVIQICQNLDGIPLALELAAARLKIMDVEQIACQVEDRFHLLTGGDRAALPRLQTMRASIDWSYQLLSDAEKMLLNRLSVFAGGWTLAAARAVCADDALPEADILDLLGGLVGKSLVLVQRRRGQEMRYRLLETIRQYAAGRLFEICKEDTVRDRHLAYFVSLAERAAPELEGANPEVWLRRLDGEIDNLRLALEWALENNVEAGLRLVSLIRIFWYERGCAREQLDWISRLLDRPEAQACPPARACALGVKSAILVDYLEDPAQAQSFAEMSLALCRELGDRKGEAFSLYQLGFIAVNQGDIFTARRLYQECLALYRASGNKVGQADVLTQLSVNYPDDIEHTRALAEESLALHKEAGDQIGIARRSAVLANLLCEFGDYTIARQLIEESLQIQRQLELKHDIPSSLFVYGRVAFRQGDWKQARLYYEESISISGEVGQSARDFWSRADLAYLLLRQGEFASAHLGFLDILVRWHNIGNTIGAVFVLEGLASLAVAEGQMERAVRLFAWADSVRQKTGDHRPSIEQADVDRDLASIRLQLDENAFEAALAAGRAMTLDEAVALARNE